MVKKEGEGENPFLLTFSDFMASLLAIFILVLVVTLIELDKKKADVQVTLNDLVGSLEDIQIVQDGIASSMVTGSQREQALTSMLDGIQADLKRSGISVVLAENGTVLRIPDQQLHFASGAFDIPPAYRGAALTIGRALLTSLSSEKNRALLDTVFIEGHTDSVPNSREMGNWGLSTYRGISLWNFWTDKPGELSQLKSLCTNPSDPQTPAKPLISVSGYADTRSTHGLQMVVGLKSDRPEDRRIDIRFTLVSGDSRNLETLQEHMKQMREKTKVLIDKLKSSGHAP